MSESVQQSSDILIIGAGAAGLATAASLKKRQQNLQITVVDPATEHYYQPGWTMVGGGIFKPQQTARAMTNVIPAGIAWRQQAVVGFDLEQNTVMLDDGQQLRYGILIVATGLKLDWNAVPGLSESLGKHGVTSNYAFGTASYTWELVQSLKRGKALFTQPPIPIKCAGAPQKAMYLSASHWRSQGCLDQIQIEFHNAGQALFGVKEYVPALMEYIEKYHVQLNFGSRLIAVDGPNRRATFEVTTPDGVTEQTHDFDMLHVCPPQGPLDLIRNSVLADSAGWLEVDPQSLQHKRYPNIFAAGDTIGTSNAKTAAAVRKQAPIVAQNVLAQLAGRGLPARYNGYGSCPLTVEHGKIVLAEFGYDGKLLPTFSKRLIDGTRPSGLAWRLKKDILPSVYWNCMLKGREWLV